MGKIGDLLLFLLVAIAMAAVSTTASARLLNGFDVSRGIVSADHVYEGGPQKDNIPSVNRPKFISAEDALEKYGSTSRAIVIEHKGEKKAYPLAILNWHEVVNDRIGGSPIVVSFNPLCATGIVFFSKLKTIRLSFGVSGLVYQSNGLMYDRQTKTLWSQIKRKGVFGELKGTQLKLLPSQHVLIAKYLKANKDAKVLSTDTGYYRTYWKDPYHAYSNTEELNFPVLHEEKGVSRKAWALYIESNQDGLVIPLPHLDPKKTNIKVTVGNQELNVRYNPKNKIIECPKRSKGLSCLSGYFFALKTFYPQATVFQAQSISK